jgi:Na+/proline symporter/nitrogen-specific signal transduction histidine kinase
MLSLDVLIAICLLYVGLLFGIAWLAEQWAARGRGGWIRSPIVYTLSLSVYCTAWTFYGAVGYATRSGLEFVTIYLGPTLVMAGWWMLLRKLVRIGREQRITSIADLISSRYGKSNLLGVLVTILAVIGTTPYIALQLQSVSLSLSVFAPDGPGLSPSGEPVPAAIWIAAGLALFTIVFGTRRLDLNERHHGVVMAIAVEAVVKLVALVAVGCFVVWGVAGGIPEMFAMIDASRLSAWDMQPGRWTGYTLLAAIAFLTLPRMFQVLVVETPEDRHLATASWAFPLYLFAMSLFVLPIAAAGVTTLPVGANPDLFVLTLPLSEERSGLAALAFLGGFSSATSMVIVAAIALSTMVSNNIVLPLMLKARGVPATGPGDVRRTVLTTRRIAIVAVLGLGYLYYRASGGGAALAAIGLISFVGVAQVAPALIGGLYWRRATRTGAALGLAAGFAVWLYALFLPSFSGSVLMPPEVIAEGPWGRGWLRPHALFGITDVDPVVHALLWSLVFNTAFFVIGSLASFPRPLERVQSAAFVAADRGGGGPSEWSHGFVESEDLLVMAQRILGAAAAQALFAAEAVRQGRGGYLPDPTPAFLERLERELAGSVGAATARAMLGQIVRGGGVLAEDLMRVADEAAHIMEYSARLETKSEELERTARQLGEANAKLTALSRQKDAFLGQISHELRTPMTSIRAFSEILRDAEGISAEQRAAYSSIIHDEALRLTRLLDDLLDLSALEHGSVSLTFAEVSLGEIADRAWRATAPGDGALTLEIEPAARGIRLVTDPDRMAQVFINLMTNARKYCAATRPKLIIRARSSAGVTSIDFVDNGRGIPRESHALIFEKFARLSDPRAAGGTGLGLAICREIIATLGGSIAYLPGQSGTAFRITLPAVRAEAAE